MLSAPGKISGHIVIQQILHSHYVLGLGIRAANKTNRNPCLLWCGKSSRRDLQFLKIILACVCRDHLFPSFYFKTNKHFLFSIIKRGKEGKENGQRIRRDRKYDGESLSRGDGGYADVLMCTVLRRLTEKMLNDPEQQGTLNGVDGFEHKLTEEKWLP